MCEKESKRRLSQLLLCGLGTLSILLATLSAQDTQGSNLAKAPSNTWSAPLQFNSFTLGVAVR